ncbi:hypothetical protein PIB30_069534 [Stylosanthes scabra]|uniref:Uncharacterized protein n=1 Tax=Stylosanthes scabra TaxID=79078 RepID=A0ABU6VN78_9FABA|nr:hypothetical protein [Stylosanthes scabra]
MQWARSGPALPIHVRFPYKSALTAPFFTTLSNLTPVKSLFTLCLLSRPPACASVPNTATGVGSTHTNFLDHSYDVQDVCYQLGLPICGDPISGCMTSWELYHGGHTIEQISEKLLGAIPEPNDK